MEKNTFTKKIKKFFYQKAQIILKKLIKINEFLKKIEIILVLVGLFLAYYAFKDTREQIRLQKEESRENSIARAWEIIGRKSLGNSGKIEALETLAKYKDPKTDKPIPLVGINMSTKTHGGKWDELPKTKIGENEFVNHSDVKERVYLQGLDLSKKTFGYQVNLNNANFSGANLRWANFEGANLWGVKFEGAYLWGAKFEDADLLGANFEGAYLRWANFEGAYLSMAKFEDADLLGANFEGAYLRWANFEGADLQEAKFEGADLRKTKFEGDGYIENADFGEYNILFASYDNEDLSSKHMPSFSNEEVEVKILLKDKDENDSESWGDFDEKISENDGYQRFNRTKGKDDKEYFFKIKILNNDKVKEAFEAGRKSKKVNNK